MQRILLITFTMICLINSSSIDEEVDISVNTYHNDNLILLATVASMCDSEANKSQEFNIPRMESQMSHDIKASSLPNKCIVMENVSKESQTFIKKSKQMLELFFVTWQDRESLNLKNEKDRKIYYTDDNVYFRLSELKKRLIGFRYRYASYHQPKETSHKQVSKSEKHKLLNPPGNSQDSAYDSISTKKRKTDDGNGSSLNIRTNIIVDLEYKEHISRLREKLMETITYREGRGRANIIGLDLFLKKHIIFVIEPSPEIVEDIKIEKVVQLYREIETLAKFGVLYFYNTVVFQKIDYLCFGCIRIFFETRVASKCLLFPEFMILNKFYSIFECRSEKITFFMRLILIYVIDKFEILFSSCIHLRQVAEDIENAHTQSRAILNRHFFIRQVFFSQLLCIFHALPGFITKYVFIAELEYIYMDSKSDDVTNVTFDIIENHYELLFFMSYNSFCVIRFSPKHSIDCWDDITTLECLNDKTVFAKIFIYNFVYIKEYYKESVKDLYSYVENHQAIRNLPDMNDILRRVEELDGNMEKMMLGLSSIYKMIHESLMKLNGT